MNPAVQIIAYIMAAALLTLAFWFAYKKQYQIAAMVVAPSFAAFISAQLMSGGVFKFQNNLTTEQMLCWGFGFAFFVMSCYFVKNNSLAYAFVVFLISVCTCFCGLSGVQAMLKTHLYWQVTSSMKAYGEKIDKYQTTVAEMQQNLSEQQSILATNQSVLGSELMTVQNKIGKQQKELAEFQAKIREAESNVFSQQSDITNQFRQISMVQSDLASAQTNIFSQQQKLTNVESLVNTLFSNTEDEHFSASATNKFILLQFGGHQLCIFRLNAVPIPNTIQAIARSSVAQFPLLPQMHQLGNILFTRFSSGANEVFEFHFRYIKDVRETRLVQNMAIVGTNVVSFDGLPIDVSNF